VIDVGVQAAGLGEEIRSLYIHRYIMQLFISVPVIHKAFSSFWRQQKRQPSRTQKTHTIHLHTNPSI
jgi:hypothetical protein